MQNGKYEWYRVMDVDIDQILKISLKEISVESEIMMILFFNCT